MRESKSLPCGIQILPDGNKTPAGRLQYFFSDGDARVTAKPMTIRAGYDICFRCAVPTPLVLMLSVHSSRRGDLLTNDGMITDPPLLVSSYTDSFGNMCHRLVAPAGETRLKSDFLVADTGLHDILSPDAREIPVAQLPADTLQYLLSSRYCDSEALMDFAWKTFGKMPPGWSRVQAIVDYVHQHIRFDYEQARPTRTASEAHAESTGVCRDYAHLAVALCRCMNIPARYVTGYLGDIGIPDLLPMDFSAWFQVWLEDDWHDFDARNNMPRIGRILMATGRDAADVAISMAFGNAELAHFHVVCEEVDASTAANLSRAVA